MMLRFDAEGLTSLLTELRPEQRVAFSALCATRQLRLYRAYALQEATGNADLLDNAMEFVWHGLADRASESERVKAWLEEVERVPFGGDSDGPATEKEDYATQAMSAVAATLRLLIDPVPRVGTWAAKAGFEVAHGYSMLRNAEADGLEVWAVTPGQRDRAAASLWVQTELEQQEKDLKAASRWDAVAGVTEVEHLRREYRDWLLVPIS